MWKGFSPEIRSEIEKKGVWMRPSAYGSPYPITRALIERARRAGIGPRATEPLFDRAQGVQELTGRTC